MGWGCRILDKEGISLLSKYDINYQFLGFGPNGEADSVAPYRVGDMQRLLNEWRYIDRFPEAAQEAMVALKVMIDTNIESLKEEPHCSSCTCEEVKHINDPYGWSIEECERFLSIPIEEVHSIHVSY